MGIPANVGSVEQSRQDRVANSYGGIMTELSQRCGVLPSKVKNAANSAPQMSDGTRSIVSQDLVLRGLSDPSKIRSV